MKNIFNILLLALTAFVYASCSSDMDSDIEKDPNRIVKKTFKARANETRTSVSGTSVVWAADNKIYVASKEKNVGLKTFTLTDGAGSDDGTFSGEMTEAEDAPYIAVYTEQTSALTFSEGKVSNIVIPKVQHPVNGGFDPTCAPMTSYTTNDNMNFKHICSFIKVVVSADLATKGVKRITFKSKKSTDVLAGTLDDVNIDTDGIVSGYNVRTKTGASHVSLENSGSANIPAGTYYLAMLPANLENGFEIKFETVDMVYNRTQTGTRQLVRATLHNLGTFKAGTEWTEETRPEVLYGGEFTINKSGDKVHFSSGNLWAVMENATTVKKWKFADQQYSVIANTSGNPRRSNCVDGDIVSLFNWVASDKYSDGVKQYGIFSGAYSATGLEKDKMPSDWGAMYTNNADTDYQWRVLTLEEWKYLLTGGQTNASAENMRNQAYTACLAKIFTNAGGTEYVNGLIIFPDGFSFSGLSAPAPTAYAGVGKKNTDWNKPCATNTYTLTQWQELERNGCMFLPCEGYVSGTSVSVSSPTMQGYYMTYDEAVLSDNARDWVSYLMQFSDGSSNGTIYTQGNKTNPQNGRCVRLVTDVAQ